MNTITRQVFVKQQQLRKIQKQLLELDVENIPQTIIDHNRQLSNQVNKLWLLRDQLGLNSK